MLKRTLTVLLLMVTAAPVFAQVVQRTVEQAAYDQAMLLAARSQRVYEALKPAVVVETVTLVGLSKRRPLAPQEKVRLTGLDTLRKVADDWARLHNAYLDILGAIDTFLEKPNRDARDEKRLAQLLAGLPRNNLNLERAMGNVAVAARNLGLAVGEF